VYANILFSIIYNLTSLKRIPEKSVQKTGRRIAAKTTIQAFRRQENCSRMESVIENLEERLVNRGAKRDEISAPLFVMPS
jgi:hypothetical protein